MACTTETFCQCFVSRVTDIWIENCEHTALKYHVLCLLTSSSCTWNIHEYEHVYQYRPNKQYTSNQNEFWHNFVSYLWIIHWMSSLENINYFKRHFADTFGDNFNRIYKHLNTNKIMFSALNIKNTFANFKVQTLSI